MLPHGGTTRTTFELSSDPALPNGTGAHFVQLHGVLATLVIGHFITQVFGVNGSARLLNLDEPALPRIWPIPGIWVQWPPQEQINDATLEQWAGRLLS